MRFNRINENNTHIRTEPRHMANTLRTLPIGMEVEVIGFVIKDDVPWINARLHDGTEGWIDVRNTREVQYTANR